MAHSLRSCPACGHQISTQAESCPHCGRPFPEQAAKRVLWGCGFLVVLYLVFWLFVFGPLKPLPSDLRPEVRTFLETHREFGKPTMAVTVAEWAGGASQHVEFGDRKFVFYINGGRVEGVYKDEGATHPQVWP